MKTDKPKEDTKKESSATKSKKKANKTNSSKKKSSFWHKLSSHRAIVVYGVFLCFFSLFLLLAFSSFFHANIVNPGQQSSRSFIDILFGELPSDNIMGRMGAFFSRLCIVDMFGFAAFGFVVLVFLSGARLVKKDWLPFREPVLLTIVSMLWTSVAIGYVLSLANIMQYQEWAGTFGVVMDVKAEDLLGKVGVGLLLVFFLAMLLYFGFKFRPKISRISVKRSPISDTETAQFEKATPVMEPKTPDTKEKKANKLRRLFGTQSHSLKEVFSIPEKEEKTEDLHMSSETLETMEPPMDSSDGSLPLSPEEEEAALNFEILSPEQPFKVNMADDGVEFTIETPLERKPNFGTKEEEEEIEVEETEHYTVDTPYDPRLDLRDYQLPTSDYLINYEERNQEVAPEELVKNKDRIVVTLKNYGIEITKISATPGPTVTLYEIVPAPGVRISKIKNLEDDIALSLAALGIRIIAPIPGKGTIGIEVPNEHPQIVSMRSMILSDKFQQSKYELPIAIGKTIANEPYVADLTKMPHLLMAGATGQGKSVGLNAIITSLLYRKHPAELKFVMVDPKKVELSLYTRIEKHYLAKLPDAEEAIITDVRKVVRTLNSLCIEMDQRYDLLKEAQVKNIKEYNPKFMARRLNPEKGHRYLPYIVLVIDEFADLIMTAGKEIEMPIARLAQLARAVGIHLIIATQRPSVNIITGIIKANFPARIAFRVTSKVDSRTILDTGGADQLIGRGDMLLSTGNDLVRLQCALVDTDEIDRIAEFIGHQKGYPETFLLPEYLDENSEPNKDVEPAQLDEKFEEAAKIIVNSQHGSTSLLQRKLQLGYNRAGRIMDQLEAAGVVGPGEGSKAREVMVRTEMELDALLEEFRNRIH